jgi:hypothetical protein
MGLNQAGWPTVCPRCQSEMDWVHTESDIAHDSAKQTAFFVPICVRKCTQDQMRLTGRAYPALSTGWRPRPAGRLKQGVQVSPSASSCTAKRMFRPSHAMSVGRAITI